MLKPIHSELLFSRNDSQDPRLGDLSKCLNLSEFSSSPTKFAILGYPDDEGIQKNGGRPGAQFAPDQIRHFLYRMTPSVERDPQMNTTGLISDLGNITLNCDLKVRHENAVQILSEIYKHHAKPISLGGGHDYGYADSRAFLTAHQTSAERPLILNFDAHLDVRPLDRGITSGTPFYRLLTEYPDKFDFLEVGIQPQCNSQAHLNWLQQNGGKFITNKQIQEKGLRQALAPHFHAKQACFLSIDVDGFTNHEAPGCSQSWATGISAREFLTELDWLHQQLDLKGLGIYEVSPPLDQDHRTSKLAALIIHQFMFLDSRL